MRRFTRRFRPRRRFMRRSGSNIEVSNFYDSFTVAFSGETLANGPFSVTTVVLEQLDMVRTNSSVNLGATFETSIPGLKDIKVAGVLATCNVQLRAQTALGVDPFGYQFNEVCSAWWVDGGSSFGGVPGLVPAFGNAAPNFFRDAFLDPTVSLPQEASYEWNFPRRTLHRQWAMFSPCQENPQLTASAGMPVATSTIPQWRSPVRLKAFNLGDKDIFCHQLLLTNSNPNITNIEFLVQLGAVIRYRLRF